jgi:hypothetical protein
MPFASPHLVATCGAEGTSLLNHSAKMPAQGDKAMGARVKQLTIASVLIAATAFSVPARAADMAPFPRAPIPIALPFDWEGFYVGAHTGTATDDVSFTQTNLTWTGTAGPFSLDSSVNTGESGTLRATNVIGSRTRTLPKVSSSSAFQLPAILLLSPRRTKDVHPGSPTGKLVAARRRTTPRPDA